jgi:hypothetical protein
VNEETNSTTGQKYSARLTPNQVDIIVGTNLASAALPSNLYRVEKVIVHPDYPFLKGHDNALARNDIALLKIHGPIKFNKYVSALRIAPSGFKPQGKKKHFGNANAKF